MRASPAIDGKATAGILTSGSPIYIYIYVHTYGDRHHSRYYVHFSRRKTVANKDIEIN